MIYTTIRGGNTPMFRVGSVRVMTPVVITLVMFKIILYCP